MRIFQGFLIIVTVVVLWMLPVADAVYRFRTNMRDDTFTVTTAPGVTTADVVLTKPLYDDDTNEVVFTSTIAETPTAGAYVTATRTLTVETLTANTVRDLTVEYPVNNFTFSPIDRLLDLIPYIYTLILIIFPILGIIVMWKYRRE